MSSSMRQAAVAAPGPRRWPVIGNPRAVLGARNIVAFYEGLWRRYGDVSEVTIAGKHMTVLSHPHHLRHVLQTHRGNYVKGSGYDGTRRVLGDSMLTLDGSTWQSRRSLANPSFHPQSLRRLTEIMVDCGASYFDGLLGTERGAPVVIDAYPAMTRLTLDVVIKTLFGADLIDVQRDVSFRSLGDTMRVLSDRFNKLPIPQWVPTPANRRYRRTMSDLDATILGIIAAARVRGGQQGTLLSMLLDAHDDNGLLSDQDLRDEVFTLFLAGHETTALTMTWFFALMDGNPEVLRRMTEEVDTVLSGRDPSFDDISALPYLRQVVNETLRLRPPAPMVARDVVRDDVIGGRVIHAGGLVLPFFWAAHRHPDFWPHPERFDPERFSAEQSRGREPWSYLPFSRGPRVCIGNTFSLTETVVLLAQLLNRAEVTVLTGADVGIKAFGTIRPTAPVLVRLTPRTR